MFWTKNKVSTRKVILSVAVLCLAAIGLITGAQFNSTDASTALSATNSSAASPAATFPANAGTLGAVPDGTGGAGLCGANKDVTFTVAGMSAPISNVEVSFTMTHTWVGDMQVALLAPGATPSHLLFSRTGAATATSFGDDSNMLGPYNFKDSAAGTHWWTAAASVTTAVPVPTGDYRTVAAGPAAAPPALTTMTTTFAGLTTPQTNGSWTLRLNDCGGGDTGSVSAASLTLTGGAAVASDAPMDFNADGRSDYVVIRNVGGGPSGQIRWFYNLSSGGSTVALDWGIATDFFISEDFDNDNKDDIAVWRPGAATVAAFYILNSATSTARVEAFGQSGDDPTIVDDYNNDGSADLAVYRAGASAGDQSIWFYRTSAGGAVTYFPWGQNGDFPAPGDYDGDGSADFVVQRNNGGGQAAFWRNLTTAPDDLVIFGTPTDVIVPGDYDGDGKTDIATIRGSGGQINWFIEPSGTAGVQVDQFVFGLSATDLPPQGDYEADGRTEAAIWRPSATANQTVFWSRESDSGTVASFPLGSNGDYPVANFNAH